MWSSVICVRATPEDKRGHTMTQLKQVLRTSQATNEAIRALMGEMVAALGGGVRVTQDRLINAMTQVARDHRDELLERLR